jgi:hypothetical protein
LAAISKRLQTLTLAQRRSYTAYAQRFGVSGFPTLVLFDDGRPVGQHVGMADMAALLRYAGVRTPPGDVADAPQAPPTLQPVAMDLILSGAPAGIVRRAARLRLLALLHFAHHALNVCCSHRAQSGRRRGCRTSWARCAASLQRCPAARERRRRSTPTQSRQ